MNKSRISSDSRIFINFPLYYSPHLINFDHHLNCKINLTLKITCNPDPDAPYRLIIKNSPINI